MPNRGRTTAILLATGAVVVGVVAVVASFRGDSLRRWLTTGDGESDLERIQGKWEVVSFRGTRRKGSKASTFVFEGNTLTGFSPQTSTYQLAEGHEPRWFDLIDSGSSRAKPGIYELKGDTLRSFLDQRFSQRPTAFESRKKRRGITLIVLQCE